MGWQLWRQDDNGNRFLVGVYATSGLAEAKLSDLTRIQHKLTYWVIEDCHQGVEPGD